MVCDGCRVRAPARGAKDWTACRSSTRGPTAVGPTPLDGAARCWPHCLLAVVAAGLRVTVPAPALDGPFRHDALAVGAVLEGVLACLLVALMIRAARAPRDALLAAQLRKLLLYVVVAGLLAIPLTYLLTRHVPPLRPVRPLKLKAGATRPPALVAPGRPLRRRGHRGDRPGRAGRGLPGLHRGALAARPGLARPPQKAARHRRRASGG